MYKIVILINEVQWIENEAPTQPCAGEEAVEAQGEERTVFEGDVLE